MHGEDNRGFEGGGDGGGSSRGVNGKGAADGNHQDIDRPDGRELRFVKLVTQVADMGKPQAGGLKNEDAVATPLGAKRIVVIGANGADAYVAYRFVDVRPPVGGEAAEELRGATKRGLL